MASKKTVKKRASGRGRESKADLRKFHRRAKAEVARLLERDRAGNLTRAQMQAGLKEVHKQLKGIGLHFYWL